MSVAVVTDSTAYLPPQLVADLGITVVPLHVVIAGREGVEGVDVTLADLSDALRRFKPVTTSRPTPAAFLQAYERLAAAGATEIVSIHISADMSGTVQGAQLAVGQSPVPVHVVDSRALGMAMGFGVVSAAEAAARGMSGSEAADIAIQRMKGCTVAFYVDTLEHLRRGGRIGAASAMLGSALAIKPILTVKHGSIVPLDRVRTSARALARLEEIAGGAVAAAEERRVLVDVSVQHLDAAARAQTIADHLGALGPTVGSVHVGELGAVVGAHVGPGTLAVTVSPRVSW